jgi:dihydrodipicolinate synthase/N-acetylneuraminate lyase
MTGFDEGAIQGVIAAVVAPRREDGHTIDIGLALDILDFVNQRGVTAVAVLGATGEFVHYDMEERSKLALMAVRRSRTPVLVNVSHSTLEGAVTLARAATQVGAAGMLLMPPHFYRYSQEDIRAYYAAFTRQTQGLAPTLLYNLPFFTNGMEAQTIQAILETGRFAGIKDSSGNEALFAALHELRQRLPFRLLIGNDQLLESRLRDAGGVISGCACAIPELITAIGRAVSRADHDALSRRAALLRAYMEAIDGFPTPFGIQLSLRHRGFKQAAPPMPLGEAAQRQIETFREWFPVFEKAMLDECRGDN